MPIDVLNNIDASFQAVSIQWLSALIPIAQRLFLLLATIELTWSGISWALASRGGEEVLASLLKKVVTLFFFYTVLLFAPTAMPMIIRSFTRAGEAATGLGTLDPGTILAQGLQLSLTMLKVASKFFLAGLIPAWLLAPAILVFFAFVVIAAKMLTTLVESYIVLGGGVLLLGFGGSRWTVGFSEGYLLYAMRVGLKLFVIYLLVGLFSAMTANWYEAVADEWLIFDPTILFEISASAVIFSVLVWKIPDFAAAMISYRAGNLERAYGND